MVSRNTIHVDGTLGSSSPEVWSVGLTYRVASGGGPLGQVDLQSWVDRAVTLFGSSTRKTWMEDIGATGNVTRVRAYAYDITGPAIRAASAPVTGRPGIGTARNDYSTARVYTLQTGLPGRSGRGRIYVPDLVSSTDGATGKSAPATGRLGALVNFMNDLRYVVSPGDPVLEPVVYSRTLNQLTQVSSIRVGDVLDNQRRRRDSLVETYTSATL